MTNHTRKADASRLDSCEEVRQLLSYLMRVSHLKGTSRADLNEMLRLLESSKIAIQAKLVLLEH